MMNVLLATVFAIMNLFIIPSDSLSITSEIQEVTVYKQQAQIQRAATLQLKTGKNIVVFKELSPFLIDNSLQLQGNQPFTILSLTRRNNYFITNNESPVIEKLNIQRDSLQNKLNYLRSDLSVLESEIKLLTKTENMINNQEMSAAELAQLLDLYRSRMAKLEKEKISLNSQINKYQDELDKTRAQLREYGNNQRKQFAEVIAEIHSTQNQEMDIELEYLVRNAQWRPLYDIRGTNINSPLEISYKASISQHTGIDWNEVTVTISSANPSLNSTLPELNPIFVAFKRTRQALNRAPEMMEMEEVVVSGHAKAPSISLDAESEMYSANIVQVNNIQNQTSFSYKIDIPYSIPSDGKGHSLEFRKEEVEADYIYSSVPKLSEKAYLTGKITDWGGLNFIPGKASIYFENTFIGNTTINPLSFDDSLQVSLGVDESIIVESKKLREFEERNFFGNRTRDNHSWEISLRNTKPEQIHITLKDQLPISQDENIKIEPKHLSDGKLDKQTGIVTWDLKLDPHQSKTLRFDYQIEYPSNQQIRY